MYVRSTQFALTQNQAVASHQQTIGYFSDSGTTSFRGGISLCWLDFSCLRFYSYMITLRTVASRKTALFPRECLYSFSLLPSIILLGPEHKVLITFLAKYNSINWFNLSVQFNYVSTREIYMLLFYGTPNVALNLKSY